MFGASVRISSQTKINLNVTLSATISKDIRVSGFMQVLRKHWMCSATSDPYEEADGGADVVEGTDDESSDEDEPDAADGNDGLCPDGPMVAADADGDIYPADRQPMKLESGLFPDWCLTLPGPETFAGDAFDASTSMRYQDGLDQIPQTPSDSEGADERERDFQEAEPHAHEDLGPDRQLSFSSPFRPLPEQTEPHQSESSDVDKEINIKLLKSMELK